jgi:tetratricopeptide (TPR) repeat protein
MRSLFYKRLFVNYRLFVALAVFSVLLASCSVEKNTLTSKAYHNLASHFNGYFYANEELTKVELGYRKSMIDDYNRVLRLYPKLDSAQSKTYEKELAEVVKMASLAIQRHQNSKWVDDSYILVGKSRMYSLDWANAIQTFKFVNTNSKDEEARHESILNLIHTFIEHKEFNNARGAVDFLKREELTTHHQKQLYLERAYLAQTQNDLDGMVRNLIVAAPDLKKADRPGRIYFIIGQVYQKLGFESEAYNYYKKCLGTSPEYEVDFYARLYMAQVTEITKSKDINTARKSFKKLLKDSKNRDFKDKIYYEMGVFEYKQKNIEQTITYLNQSIRLGTNKRVDGEAYLRLGEMYYGTRSYELSQAYYDSAVSALPVDYESLEIIKKRQAILSEFVKNLNTIRWQDSLLVMAQMDTATLRAHVDSVTKANTKVDPVVKRKRKLNGIEIEQAPTSIFATDQGTETTEGSVWYFANASAVSLGQSEFARIWGGIPLEDNWRRSQRTTARPQLAQTIANSEATAASTENTAPTADPAKIAFTQLLQELPDTEEKKAEARKKIEDAYYALGDIYSLQLEEPENAVDTYKKLLQRFPGSDYEPEVLYRLYILTKDDSTKTSEGFANQLKEKYPESSWTKILLNPDHLAEAGKAVVRQKALYAIAYEKYLEEKYDSANVVLHQAIELGFTPFTPNLTLLKILIVGKTQATDQYQKQLEDFIVEFPEQVLTPFAKKLLEQVSKKSSSTENDKPLFSETEGEHLYLMVYKTDPILEKLIIKSLQDFHKSSFPDQTLSASNSTLQEDRALCIVSQFSDRSSAIAYITLFNEKLATMNNLKTYNFNNFVISKENFETLKRTQALNEYLTFYTRHYQTENP